MFLSKIKKYWIQTPRKLSQFFYFVLGARGYASALDNGRWTDTQGRKHAIIILSKLEHTQVPRSFRKQKLPIFEFFSTEGFQNGGHSCGTLQALILFRTRTSKMGGHCAERLLSKTTPA